MATNNFTLAPQPPTTFTYYGQTTAGGPVIGGVLMGDYVNNSTTTPPGSNYNVPTSTLVSTVPVSAILELQSTTGTLLIPRMTTTQRNALVTIVNGMIIYNSTTTTFQFYQNGSWVSLSAGAGGVVGPGGGSTDTAIATWNGAGGNALNNSVVLLDGSGNITGANSIANGAGAAATPSYTFTGDTDTGMYHVGANNLGLSVNGALVASVATTGLAVTGLVSATTTVTAGTNLVATAGSVSAATTVTAGTGIVSTTGTIQALAGNVIAGSSANAATLISFPATAANGSLILAAVNAGGAFNTTVSNGTMGQSTVYTMGDIGASTGGLVVATTPIRVKSVAGAAAAGGAAAQSFTDTFCTSGSNVVGNWNTQANPVSVLKIVPGNGSFVVTSSGDAGVGTFNYIITK